MRAVLITPERLDVLQGERCRDGQEHEWDTEQVLTSNPPRVRCKKCLSTRLA
jgi:hypothetical protein